MVFSNQKKKLLTLLRWSEKYTKTDMVYLTKGSFWLYLAQGLSSLATLLLSIAFANFLPKETYGLYKYILSICGILSIFCLPGLSTALIQSVARGYEGSFKDIFRLKITSGLVGSVVCLVIAAYYYSKGNALIAFSLLIAAFFIPFIDSFTLHESYLSGKKNFKLITKFFSFNNNISLILILLALFFTRNIFCVLLAYFSGWTFSRMISFYRTLKLFKMNKKKDKSSISYGIHLTGLNLIPLISNYFDKLIIFHYLGAADVAIYSVAVAPVEQLKLFYKNITFLGLPKLSAKKNSDIRKTFFHKIKIILYVSLIIGAAYILLSPFFFSLIFPKYVNSIIYSQVFALSLIFIGITMLYTTLLQAQKQKKYLTQYNFFYSILLITLLLILTPRYQIMGAIVAKLLTRFLSTVILIIQNPLKSKRI